MDRRKRKTRSNPSCWRWRYSRFRREIYFCHAGPHVRTRLLLATPFILRRHAVFWRLWSTVEGTSQMYQSLMKKFTLLPDDTLICCAHEYTLATKFALSILPHDSFINEYYRKVKELRVKQMILPVILKNERKINLFKNFGRYYLINEINKETILQQPEARFAWLRSKKDTFLIIYLSFANFAVK